MVNLDRQLRMGTSRLSEERFRLTMDKQRAGTDVALYVKNSSTRTYPRYTVSSASPDVTFHPTHPEWTSVLLLQ
jgi:hypothetical protein